MKVRELTEQIQRRKSSEELAAAKAAPDYWKKGVRAEFNAILKKYGATSKERNLRPDVESTSLPFYRDISVLVTSENSVTLPRDKRAVALVDVIAKWLHGLTKRGFRVRVFYFASIYSGADFEEDANLDDVLLAVKDNTRVMDTINTMRSHGERGQKGPLRFDIRFKITKVKDA